MGRSESEMTSQVYHCVSRVVDRRFAFGQVERERFVRIMSRAARFTGVRVLTFTVLSNHFHLLLEVPPRTEVSSAELIARARAWYGAEFARRLYADIRQAVGPSGESALRRIAEPLLRRMFDLSEFMKMLKQSFSIWYNRSNNRVGTLWEERFRSLLVEDAQEALSAVASYIELNCVRAGLAKDPRDYRWCGLGSACGGVVASKDGVRRLVGVDGATRWREAEQIYFGWLQHYVEEPSDSMKLPDSRPLLKRVRYFTDGLILGGKKFVDGQFTNQREFFGPKRMTGARKMRGITMGELHVLRDLQVRLFSEGMAQG